MKQTLEQAANEYMETFPVKAAIKCGDIEDLESHIKVAFKAGYEWQSKQIPWILVKERLPDYNENIIIMCEHGAIFNGTYCNDVWFCMDGYIHDTFRGEPVYSSMVSIPPL